MLRQIGLSEKFKENILANVTFLNLLKINPQTLVTVLLFIFFFFFHFHTSLKLCLISQI